MHQKMGIDFSKIRFVFLDRDGVLNRKPAPGGYITCCAELELLPGAAEAVAALNRSGRKVIVVTNQRGIALGLYSADELGRIHAQLARALSERGAHVDGIYVCPHDNDECDCRKPGVGLFEQAMRDFPEARPDNSVMVGDSLRDIEAGARWGMAAVIIDDGLEEDGRAKGLAQMCVGSLRELVSVAGV